MMASTFDVVYRDRTGQTTDTVTGLTLPAAFADIRRHLDGDFLCYIVLHQPSHVIVAAGQLWGGILHRELQAEAIAPQLEPAA